MSEHEPNSPSKPITCPWCGRIWNDGLCPWCDDEDFPYVDDDAQGAAR